MIVASLGITSPSIVVITRSSPLSAPSVNVIVLLAILAVKSESINFIPFKNTLKLSVLKFKDVPPRSAPENNVWPESALYLKSVN